MAGDGPSRELSTEGGGKRRRTRSRASLVSSLGWFAGSYGVAILGYLVLNAVASRMLGRDEFGYFLVATTVTTIVGELSLIGVHRAGLREVARLGEDTTEAADTLGALRLRVRVACRVTLPAAGVLTGSAAYFLPADASSTERLSLAGAVAVLTVLTGHQKLWGNFLRGFGHLRFAGMLEGRSGGALVALFQAVALVATYVAAPQAGLATALWACAVGFAPPLVVGYLLVRGHWRHARVPAMVPANLRGVLGRDWRFASGQLGSYLNANLELWAAGLLLSATDTSLFGAALRLSLLIVTPLTSLQVVFAPAIARIHASGQTSQLQGLVRTGATIAAVPMVLILVPVIVAPGPILDLVFGEGYAAASVALLLILLGSIANVLTGLCGAVLVMTDREGIVASVQWVGVVVRIAAGAAGALVLGLDGLALSAGLVTAAIWCYLWYAAKTRAQVRTDPTIRPQLHLMRSTVG